jgi:hypothetical protein
VKCGLSLREEHRLRMFVNRVLRGIFRPKKNNVAGERRSCTMRSFIICTHPQISLGRSSQGNEMDGTCGMHGRGEKIVQGFGGKV